MKKGFIIINVVVYAGIAVIIISSLVAWAGINLQASRTAVVKEKSIQIAEAGIDYYRWHLAHAPLDFTDGTGQAGPYVHPFTDKNGTVIGSFSLSITPPISGSTIVTIESTGSTVDDSSPERTIRTRLAIPSLAKFAFVSNNDMRFGAGTEVFGPIHANGGIRFDGLAHNIISSAQSTYDDTDSDDCNGSSSFGVHTCLSPADPSPPAAVPNRVDVFESGREFPVPAVDFVGLTSDLAQIKTDATAGGSYFAPSGALGYRILFNAVANDTDTYTVHRVNNLRPAPSGCTKPGAPPSGSDPQLGWGTWSIGVTGTPLTLIGTYPVPANGLIFVEDNLWVEGAISNSRVSVASGRFPDNPSTRTSITVNEDIDYANIDGTDVIALIAQNNVNVGLFSATNLEIDAALMAQNGRIGRYYYNNNCRTTSPTVNWYSRSTLTLYGMIATYGRYGFAYTDGTGYATRTISYDANLLYGPPPSFPLTSDQYTTISWEEI